MEYAEKLMFTRIGVLAVLSFLLFHTPAFSHNRWSNGDAVPSWVGASCCGKADAHHLDSDQVHTLPDGWHIDGIKQVLAYGRELPSQDGDYWIFYQDYKGGGQSPVYCFFAPIKGF